MKRFIYVIFTLSLLLLSACEQFSEIDAKIEISKSSLEFSCEGGAQEIEIEAPCDWSISCAENWVAFSQNGGEKGKSVLTITVAENSVTEPRKTTVNVENKRYNLVSKIELAQKEWSPQITINPESLRFTIEGGTREITITSNFEYNVSKSANWLSVTRSENGIKVTAPSYAEVDERTAEITISNDEYRISRVIKVAQGAFVPEWTVTPDALNFATEGGTQKIAITANFEYAYTANADWVTLKKGSDGIEVTVPNYDKTEDRTAEITISNSEYGISKVVSVKQSAFAPSLTITPDALNFTTDGGTQEIAITSNFEYNVSKNANWLSVARSENGIKVTAPNYDGVDKRVAEITISNDEYRISKVVKVTQGAFEPSLTITPDAISFATEGGTQEVVITSNFQYSITKNANWISVAQSEKGIKVTVPSYEGVEDRSAKITISSEKYGISKEISVSQKGINAISYISTDNEIVVPNKSDVFGANIVSNTYKDGKGVIIFDGPITTIGDDAFSKCANLKNITIPNSVTSIGSSAFSECLGLKSITIPDSVISIGSYAFWACRANLTEVIIGNSVASIGRNAFYGCSLLTSITLPDSITSIGYGAFRDCINLATVYCRPTTPPTGGSLMFDNNKSGRKIYVPRNSVSAYKSASGWNDYSDYIVGYDF